MVEYDASNAVIVAKSVESVLYTIGSLFIANNEQTADAHYDTIVYWICVGGGRSYERSM